MVWNWNASELSSHPTYTYFPSLVVPQLQPWFLANISPYCPEYPSSSPSSEAFTHSCSSQLASPGPHVCTQEVKHSLSHHLQLEPTVLRIDSCLWPGETEFCKSWCCLSCHRFSALEGHISRKVKITFCDTLYPQRLAWCSLISVQWMSANHTWLCVSYLLWLLIRWDPKDSYTLHSGDLVYPLS